MALAGADSESARRAGGEPRSGARGIETAFDPRRWTQTRERRCGRGTGTTARPFERRDPRAEPLVSSCFLLFTARLYRAPVTRTDY